MDTSKGSVRKHFIKLFPSKPTECIKCDGGNRNISAPAQSVFAVWPYSPILSMPSITEETADMIAILTSVITVNEVPDLALVDSLRMPLSQS